MAITITQKTQIVIRVINPGFLSFLLQRSISDKKDRGKLTRSGRNKNDT